MKNRDKLQISRYSKLENANSSSAGLHVSISTSNIPFIGARNAQGILDSISRLSSSKFKFKISAEYLNHPEYGNMLNLGDLIRIYPTTANYDFIDVKVTSIPLISSPGFTEFEGLVIRGDAEILFSETNNLVRWAFFHQDKSQKNHPVDLFAENITKTSAVVSWKDSALFQFAKSYQVMWRAWGQDIWEFSSIITNNKYTITGLTPATRYEWSVMSYFTHDLKNFSNYAPSSNFTTMK